MAGPLPRAASSHAETMAIHEDKLLKTKMAKSTPLFEDGSAKPANTPWGKLSPKPVASAALQPISIAASPPPAFPRIGDAPWAFRPFRSHRRTSLGPFALSPRSAPQLHALRPFHPGQRCGRALSRRHSPSPLVSPHAITPRPHSSRELWGGNPLSTRGAVSRVHYFPSLPCLCSLIGHKLIYPIRLVLGRRSAMCGRCAQASRSRLSRTRSHE